MKDNLNQTVEYSIDSNTHDPKVRRTAVVRGYSNDGAIVFLVDQLDDGTTQERQLPVGTFLVHAILKKGDAQDELVNAGLAAPAPAAEDRGQRTEDGPNDERRLSQSPIASEKRRSMGKKTPPDHGTAAAQPDEFADKSES